MFVRHIIMASTFALVIALGLFWPDALVWLIRQADDFRNWFSDQFNLSGYAALIVQLSGAGTALVLSAIAITVGLGFRKFARRAFTWNRILSATLLPLLAHMTEWMLGYFAPATLTPVYKLADQLLTLINQDWLTSMRAFDMETHAKNLIENAIIIVLLLLVWQGLKLAWRRFRRPTTTTIPPVGGSKRNGLMIKLNPITWNLGFRPLAGLVLGSLYAGLLYCLVWGIATLAEKEMTIPFAAWIALAVVVGALGVLPEGGEPDNVPETRFYAMVTFWGIPLGWLLRTTGDYPWIGKRLGLGRTTKTTPEFTDESGNVKAGEIPFTVWDSANRTIGEGADAKGDPVIKAPAKNRALISATLILVLQLERPRRMLDSDDPELDIGESARQEFREMVGNFVDTDLQHLQQHTIDVLTGQELVTCFLPKSTYGQKAGGMIHDKGGKVMFRMLDRNLTQKEREDKINDFQTHVEQNAKEHMLELVKKGGGNVQVDFVKVEKPITHVIEALGFKLVRGTFGDIILSKKVTDTAEEASSEPDQRIIRIESARTNKLARKELLPDAEEQKHPMSELAMVLEAAADDKTGSVQVVMVPGGNSLAQAAVAGASQLNKKKDGK